LIFLAQFILAFFPTEGSQWNPRPAESPICSIGEVKNKNIKKGKANRERENEGLVLSVNVTGQLLRLE
jgi:hypothetical protein